MEIKQVARVISDNGYKIELIRPFREVTLRLGTKIEFQVKEEAGDLQKIFDNQIDEETQERMMKKLKDALEPALEQKISTK